MIKIKKKSYKVLPILKKKFNNNLIKFSVITVVYNGEKTLEKTIKNILSQKYKNFEYIIVYTPSDDKTYDIIKKYRSKINKIIINYDVGIYKSMNLGAYFSSGEYINYMNSGDYFFNKKTLHEITKLKKKTDVIYGDCEVYYDGFKRKIKALNQSYIKDGMFFSHQSCFVKRKLQFKLGFKTRYYYSADYDFFCRVYKKNIKFLYTNKLISKCMSNGIVDRKRFITLSQNLEIAKKNFKKEISNLEILKKKLQIIFQYILYYLKIFIPNFLIKFILKKKYFIK